MDWVWSDTHFDHDKLMRKYCHRPFDTVGDMNDFMLSEAKRLVGDKDRLIHIGDVAWHRPEYFIKAMPGYKILILGNHDRNLKRWHLDLFDEVYDQKLLKLHDGSLAFFNHFPMECWDRSHFGIPQLYGHRHCQSPENYRFRRIDCSVDGWGFRPWPVNMYIDKIETSCDVVNIKLENQDEFQAEQFKSLITTQAENQKWTRKWEDENGFNG